MFFIGICDDELSTCSMLETEIASICCQFGNRVDIEVFYSGRDLIKYLQQGHLMDLLFLDIMLPDIDGFQILKQIRQKYTFPVIMLTAKTQEMDKVTGLMMGADDYVTKPFSPSELVARVDAVYRRVAQFTRAAEPNFSEELRSGRFVLNLRNRSFTKDGNPVELTQVEFQIMEYFISNAGKALKRSEILKHVWGSGYVGEEKIVDVNIRRLRMKIEDEPSNPRHVVTVWGIGYRWDK